MAIAGNDFECAGNSAKAAAHQHVVADDPIVFAHGHQAEIVGIDIDAIVAGQGDAGFEFSRQIDRAVKRFDRIGKITLGRWPMRCVAMRGAPIGNLAGQQRSDRTADDLTAGMMMIGMTVVGMAIFSMPIAAGRSDAVGPAADKMVLAGVGIAKPDFVVGAGSRGDVPQQFNRQPMHFFMHRVVVVRRRAAGDVALDVAAGGQRGELHFIDPLDHLLQIRLTTP